MAAVARAGVTVVLDASAVLALLFREAGAARVADHANGSLLSAVNLIEILEKVAAKGGSADRVLATLAQHGIVVAEFDAEQAGYAAELKAVTHKKNIALADRACLALGRSTGRPILTGDRAWVALGLDLDIRLIR